MKNKKLIRQLKMFIEPHPTFKGSEEDIYTPKKGYSIKFWFEGGFQLEVEYGVEINFNSIRNNILVLSFLRNKKHSILRITTNRVIAFELLPENNSKDALNDLYKLGNDRRN